MYDAIIVGSRAAGSPTALLLARHGHRVLLVDKVMFPSDTLSTHYIWQGGIAKLHEWSLLDRLKGTECPPIAKNTVDLGELVLSGAPSPAGPIGEAFAPRRTVIDKLLLDAALESGADVREGYGVEQLITRDGAVAGVRGKNRTGSVSEERARIVIGADGMRSLVARSVNAPVYNERPCVSCCYYTYWSGVELPGAELYLRDGYTVAAFPTNFGLSCVVIGWALAQFERVRANIEGSYLAAIDQTALGPRIRAGRREERYRGTADIPNFFRKPYGRGWALVGDAGYHKDPQTAQGIMDAFFQADWLTTTLHRSWSGEIRQEDALAQYEQKRNEHFAAEYESTWQRARQAPPPPDLLAILRGLQGNQEQINRFLGIDAGTVRAEEFFAPDNVSRILGSTRSGTFSATRLSHSATNSINLGRCFK